MTNIHSVTRMWSRRAGGNQSQDLLTFRRTYKEAYQVLHDPDPNMQEVQDAVAIIGQQYPGETGFLWCTDINVEPVGPVMSIVPVTFAGEVGGGSGGSPVDVAGKVTWKNAKTNEEIDTDGFGVPLINTLGETVRKTKDISDFVLTAERKFDAVDTFALVQYLDSTNSDQFWGWPPGTCILDTYEASQKLDGANGWWDVKADFIFRVPYRTIPAHAWWHRYLNESYYAAQTRVSISGGGGTGAAGRAIVRGGQVQAIEVVSYGWNYDSPPNVTITSPTGTGATATADAPDNGRIRSITVTNGGQKYKALRRIVDASKRPLSTKQPIAPDGTLLEGGGFWIERPKKSFSLPYNALGMF